MKIKKWAVQTVDYYEGETYRDSLEMDVKLFNTEEEAIRELNRAIRCDWTTEVVVDEEYVYLADCRGMSEQIDSVKYSEWYYSDDGKLAWAFYGAGSGHKGKVVEVELEIKEAENGSI